MRTPAVLAAAFLCLSLSARAAVPIPPLRPDDTDNADNTLLNDTTNLPLIEADVKPLKGSGWLRQSASLLYYDSAGDLANEIPLSKEDDGSGVVRDRLGGAAPNGRFAWTLERSTTWNAGRTKKLASKRLLRVYGDDGKELWEAPDADVPEEGDPVRFSQDGTTLLVALHEAGGWTVSARNYLGTTLMDAGPLPQLKVMTLTPGGKYAMIRWLVPDQSATHTFLDLAAKARRDIPSSEFSWTVARVDDDGKVYAGKRLVFDFAAPAAKPAAKPGQ